VQVSAQMATAMDVQRLVPYPAGSAAEPGARSFNAFSLNGNQPSPTHRKSQPRPTRHMSSACFGGRA